MKHMFQLFFLCSSTLWAIGMEHVPSGYAQDMLLIRKDSCFIFFIGKDILRLYDMGYIMRILHPQWSFLRYPYDVGIMKNDAVYQRFDVLKRYEEYAEAMTSEQLRVHALFEYRTLLCTLALVNKKILESVRWYVNKEKIVDTLVKSVSNHNICFDDIVFLPFHTDSLCFSSSFYTTVYTHLLSLLTIYLQVSDTSTIKMKRGIGNCICYVKVDVPQAYDFTQYYMYRKQDGKNPRDFVRLDIVQKMIVDLLIRTLYRMEPGSRTLSLSSSVSFNETCTFSFCDVTEGKKSVLHCVAASEPDDKGFYTLTVTLQDTPSAHEDSALICPSERTGIFSASLVEQLQSGGCVMQ